MHNACTLISCRAVTKRKSSKRLPRTTDKGPIAVCLCVRPGYCTHFRNIIRAHPSLFVIFSLMHILMSSNRKPEHPSEKMYQHRQRHKYRQHFCSTRIPKRQIQLQMPAFQMLRFLLLLVCYCGQQGSQAASAAMDYGAKLSNCYDKAYGFRGFQLLNDSLTTVNQMIWDPENGTYPRTNDPSGHVFGGLLRNDTDSMAILKQSEAPQSTGWKCCCWNATNSVSSFVAFV